MAVDCTPGSLVDLAACFNGLSSKQHQAIVTYLLCQIANAGGGAAQSPWTSDIDGGCFNLNNVCKYNGVGIYRALLTQADADPPVATVLENTIGNVVWSRSSDGTYFLTLASAFPASRTQVLINSIVSAGDEFVATAAPDGTNNAVLLQSFASAVASDNVVGANGATPIQILVYPETPQCPDCAT